jgi:hypothetical protein
MFFHHPPASLPESLFFFSSIHRHCQLSVHFFISIHRHRSGFRFYAGAMAVKYSFPYGIIAITISLQGPFSPRVFSQRRQK